MRLVRTTALAALVALLSGAVMAEDYLGGVKIPRMSSMPVGTFSLASEPVNAFSPFSADNAFSSDAGMRLRLGYQYSRFFSVQSEFVDYGRAPAEVFASPASLSSAFRSTGFGVDTIARMPVWRSLSFYGRLGAYHGDVRNPFASYSTSLLASPLGGTRVRYGLGVRYDFNGAFGVHADVERYAPMGAPLGEPEQDQFSIGLNWRF
jgi:Outer membrane protein beta-barrel domain